MQNSSFREYACPSTTESTLNQALLGSTEHHLGEIMEWYVLVSAIIKEVFINFSE